MPAVRVVRRPPASNSAILQALPRHRAAVLSSVSVIVFFTENMLRLERPLPIPMHTSTLTGMCWLYEIIDGHPERCRAQLGMYPAAFALLCWELQNGGLDDGRVVTVMEQVAIFIYWMVHGSSQRELMERFQHSGDTISKYTNRVLDVVVDEFYAKYIQDPADKTPDKILQDPRYFPLFCHCRGAVDGVHIPAHVLEADLVRYRDRQGNVTQNVLAACDFDMHFVYTMSGYEGTAADGRLFDTARRNGFVLPAGKYYLADAGFMNCDALMTPYLTTCYHLQEFRRGGRAPENYRELFNLRHAKLRNIVERIFGVCKRRFRILISRPECSYKVQAKIVSAAAALRVSMTL